MSKSKTDRKADRGGDLESCEHSSSKESSQAADLTSLRRQQGWAVPTSSVAEPS